MAALVDDLLELSRLESGTLALELGAVLGRRALNTVSAGLLPIALDRGIRLAGRARRPASASATGDRRRVEQIVTNLAANAIKFAGWRAGRARPGGSTARSRSSRSATKGRASRRATATRIFERFYRMADHEPITGTGLGPADRAGPRAGDGRRARGGQRVRASARASCSSCPGPPGPIPAAAMAAATRAALASETDHLRTLGLLRAGAAGRRDRGDRAGLRGTIR